MDEWSAVRRVGKYCREESGADDVGSRGGLEACLTHQLSNVKPVGLVCTLGFCSRVRGVDE